MLISKRRLDLMLYQHSQHGKTYMHKQSIGKGLTLHFFSFYLYISLLQPIADFNVMSHIERLRYS